MLDAMRIGFLAPDFLLARTGFVGQALRPGGREQLTALIRQGTILYTGTRVLNMLLVKTMTPIGINHFLLWLVIKNIL